MSDAVRELVISLEARLAIAVVLEDSELHFGARARARYKALIFQAIQDIVTEPERPNVRRLPAAGATIRLYHLHGSRRRAAPPGHRVRKPVAHAAVWRRRLDNPCLGSAP